MILAAGRVKVVIDHRESIIAQLIGILKDVLEKHQEETIDTQNREAEKIEMQSAGIKILAGEIETEIPNLLGTQFLSLLASCYLRL